MRNPFSQYDARTVLAFLITLSAIAGTSILSVTIISNGERGEIEKRASLVLNSTLPLFGTWVGTVLAYYFARENFEAASRSTERLAQLSSPPTQGDLQFIPVLIAMTPRSKMFAIDTTSIKMSEVLSKLDDRELRRLPILETEFLKNLVYYEDLSRYYYPKAEAERDAMTLQIFLDDATTSKKPFAIIDSEATLTLAKEAMKKIPDCRDVFITKTGKIDSEVIGFLTNVDIEKYSKT